MDFTNKVILITGASQGIGKLLAETLANYNGIVIGTYNKTKVKHNKIDYVKCDLSDESAIKKLINNIKKKYGQIDCLVNCAALCLDNDLYDKTKEEFMQVLEVNLVAPFLLTKYATLLMNKGVIINVSSTDGIDTYQTLSMDYASSKAGLNILTKTLANRLPNLKVCAIAPNWVDTETVLQMDSHYLQQELNRINQKELIKKEVVVIKIIEAMVNSDIVSGEIIKVVSNNE